MKTLLFLSLFLVALVYSNGMSTSCPTLRVDPCICTQGPFAYLVCDKIDDQQALKNVFINSAFTRYSVVKITNSVLQYLPHDMFHNVEVVELNLYNVTLVQMFDEIPENTESLKTLHMESVLIFRGIIWEHIEPMVHLRILNIYFNTIEALDDDFVKYAPKNLEHISFYDTKTSKIEPGVLKNFPYLDKIAIDHGELTELNRKMFPVPFNARFMYFTENQLKFLPEDLFTDMPKLQTISFRGNKIAFIPANMFTSGFDNLQFLVLEGNPLDCDCNLNWLIQNKRYAIQGTCFAPPLVAGKKLNELESRELFCY